MSQLISIAMFTIAVVLTVYAWRDRITGQNAHINEAFANETDMRTLAQQVMASNQSVMSDEEARQAYVRFLTYIRADFSKGIHYVKDFGKRFFGDDVGLKKDLDVRTILDNYASPI